MQLSDNAPLLIFHRCDDELLCQQMTRAEFQQSLNAGDYELITWVERWPTCNLDEWPDRTGCVLVDTPVVVRPLTFVTKWEVV